MTRSDAILILSEKFLFQQSSSFQIALCIVNNFQRKFYNKNSIKQNVIKFQNQ